MGSSAAVRADTAGDEPASDAAADLATEWRLLREVAGTGCDGEGAAGSTASGSDLVAGKAARQDTPTMGHTGWRTL